MATKAKPNTTKDIFSKVAASLMVVSIIYIASISSDIDQLSTDIQLIQQRLDNQTRETREKLESLGTHKKKVENISDRVSKIEWELKNHLEVHDDDDKR